MENETAQERAFTARIDKLREYYPSGNFLDRLFAKIGIAAASLDLEKGQELHKNRRAAETLAKRLRELYQNPLVPPPEDLQALIKELSQKSKDNIIPVRSYSTSKVE